MCRVKAAVTAKCASHLTSSIWPKSRRHHSSRTIGELLMQVFDSLLTWNSSNGLIKIFWNLDSITTISDPINGFQSALNSHEARNIKQEAKPIKPIIATSTTNSQDFKNNNNSIITSSSIKKHIGNLSQDLNSFGQLSGIPFSTNQASRINNTQQSVTFREPESTVFENTNTIQKLGWWNIFYLFFC